jgi:hypothetical protein
MRNAWQDDPDPDATRALPVYRRFGPESVRYADSGASQSFGASGPSAEVGHAEFDQYAPFDQYAESDQYYQYAESDQSDQYDRHNQYDQPAEYDQYDQYDQPARHTTGPPGARPGWFARHRPDLWVLCGGCLVTAAAFAAAFAAASGAMATSQQGTAQPAAAHATATPAARPACVSPDAGR